MALAAVVLVQLALAFVLLRGLRVDLSHPGDVVERLIAVTLEKPPTPPEPVKPRKYQHRDAAPKASERPGGSPGQQPAHAPPSVTPVVAVQPSAAPSGGGSGTGSTLGAGSGGGTDGNGYGGGGGGGGTDLEQIAGEITPRDYPRDLREAGVGGIVGLSFRVEPTGLVSRCTVTHSSGVPELDALTCRLIQQRFIYRASTDRFGRPVEDEVEGDHDWIARSH